MRSRNDSAIPRRVEMSAPFSAKDPSDTERVKLLSDLRRIVLATARKSVPSAPPASTANHIRRIVRYGRLLASPERQPEGTDKPASYEVGKLFQLDRNHVMLSASLREQGGHDFEIGNDAFIFSDLSEIVPERAIQLNRLEPHHVFKFGKGWGVQSKFPGHRGVRAAGR